MRLLASAGAPTHSQQSNTDLQKLFGNSWLSSTSLRIASGSRPPRGFQRKNNH
jgi:hypothetical protein